MHNESSTKTMSESDARFIAYRKAMQEQLDLEEGDWCSGSPPTFASGIAYRLRVIEAQTATLNAEAAWLRAVASEQEKTS